MEKVFAITLTTYRELVRSKVLYAVFFFVAALILVASAFGSVTIGDQILVIKDFGLFSISLCSIAFSTIAGATLLKKELERKTIYNILAKPVERWHFVLGKFFGMTLTIALTMLLMMAGLETYLSLFQGQFDGSLWLALYFYFLEVLVICAASMFFSSIVVTPLLSGLFTFGLFLAGRSVEYLLYFIQEGTLSGVAASICKGAYALLPHLSKLQVGNEIVFGQLPSLAYAGWCGLYATSYAGILLLLSVFFFRRKEFN
jgi:Cu-processing system permease protein